MTDFTIGIIKPDAAQNGTQDAIMRDIERAGFVIRRTAAGTLDRTDAEALYEEHREKPHFKDLIDFTVSGPVVILDIASPFSGNIPMAFRHLMGPTKLEDAQPGTLRHAYATDFRRNAIHGSDSAESAVREAALLEHYFARSAA